MGTQTKHITLNPHGKCIACKKCVEACPKHILKLTPFFWHKHAITGRNAADCIGCYKCIKACEYGVFTKNEG